jgi:hypothetical protein
MGIGASGRSRMITGMFACADGMGMRLTIRFVIPSMMMIVLRICGCCVVGIISGRPRVSLLRFVVRRVGVGGRSVGILTRLSGE